MPFAALHDGKGWLVERMSVTQMVLGAPDKGVEASQASWTVAGMGTTQAIPPFRALPGVRDELSGIVKTGSGPGLLPGRIFLDKEFGVEQFESALGGQYSVLHIGSHAVFRPGDQSLSFLLLGDGSKLSLGDFEAMGRISSAIGTVSPACESQYTAADWRHPIDSYSGTFRGSHSSKATSNPRRSASSYALAKSKEQLRPPRCSRATISRPTISCRAAGTGKRAVPKRSCKGSASGNSSIDVARIVPTTVSPSVVARM